jgi:hypothetical protein
MNQPIITGNKYYCGIDCGLKGAITFFNPLDLTHGLQVYDMPLRPSHIKDRREPNGNAIFTLFDGFEPFLNHAPVYFEQPHAMPRDGAAGAFTFGEGVGIVKGVLQSLGIRYYPINPAVWKAKLGIGKDKKESVARAIQTFNLHKNVNEVFLKSKDGRAESALLAFLAYQTFGKEKRDEKI